MANIPVWFQYPNYQWKTKHAVVIGGGLAGSQMAWHLGQLGWKVTLIERHKTLAGEASGNPAGVISPKMTAKESIGETFYVQGFRYILAQLKILEQQGHVIDRDNCGVIQLSHNEREQARWSALKQRKLDSNLIQLLNSAETSKVSGLSSISKSSIPLKYTSCYFPQGGWINPASLVKALVNHSNCKVIYQTEVLSLRKSEQGWEIYNKDNHCIEKSELVIIANGKDLQQFEQSRFLPGMPVAGQTSSSVASEQSAKLKTVIGHEGYFIPAISISSSSKKTKYGQHIFGATFERDNSNPQSMPESNHQNLTCLTQYLPELANSLTDLQSGHVAVRMTTPDRFPYVGALPDLSFYTKNYDDLHQGKHWKNYPQARYQKGLFVLGGFGSRGIISSGLCANALCQLLDNNQAHNRQFSEPASQILSHCHPGRFIIKSLKRGKVIVNPEP